jgi:hypothetical protein
MSVHRLTPAPNASHTERLHLVLAGLCVVTLTSWGLAMAAVVLGLLVARRQARRSLERSAAVRRGVLSPAQRSGMLHPAGHRRQALARP